MKKSYKVLELLNKVTWEIFGELTDEMTTIDKENITDELINLPTIYCYYHGCMVEQKSILDACNFNIEILLATTRREEADKYWAIHNKKPTEKMLDSLTLSNKEYISKVFDALEEDRHYNLLKALVAALNNKKDMLIQLSSNLRNETKLFKQ